MLRETKSSKGKFSTRLYVVTAAILGLASITTFWASAKVGWLGSTSTVPPVSVRPLVQNPVEPAPASVTVETVRLTPQGFEPKEFERSAGKFLLGIDNRISLDEFTFEIVQEDGHKVRQLKLPKGQIRLRKLLNLQAGRYLLRDVDHPEWTCSIVLTP